MTHRQSTTISLWTLRTIAMAGGLIVGHAVCAADATHITPIRKEALIQRQPSEVVDLYLNQILCSNKTFKLETQNRALTLGRQLKDGDINRAFASEIFYSLKPGEEALGSEHMKATYAKAASLLDNLRVLAVFFGHDIHNFFREQNELRAKNKQTPLSKEEFMDQFDSGEIVLTASGINLNSFVKDRLAEVEKLSSELKYGCDGKQNFLHRKGSDLARTVSESTFLIPATTTAIEIASHLTGEDDNHMQRKPASTGSYPQRPVTEAGAVAGRVGNGRFKKYNDFVRRGVPIAALNEAMNKYFYYQRLGEFTNSERVVVVDYTSDSDQPRFWVLNLSTGNATGMKMGHGDGKGLLPGNEMMPKRQTAFVSNADTSDASPWGAMVFGENKVKGENSKFNYAKIVKGLEKQNANVESRNIISHEAINSKGVVYVNDVPGVEAGRSNGCFALSPANAKWVQDNLPAGTYIYAYKGSIPDVAGPQQARQAMSRFR